MKFKAKAKDCQLLVKVKASFSETIDEKKLDRFARAYLRGFLKPKLVKKNVVEYTGPVGISIYERLKKPVSKRDFLFILEQIVVAVQKLQANNMGINNMVMNLQYVFINEVTKEVQFIYIPTVAGIRNLNLIEFIETVVYSVRPSDQNDDEFVSRFIYFFKAMKPFDINKVEAFVAKEDRSVVNTIKKQNAGQSGFMTSKHQHYVEHYEEKEREQEQEDSSDEPQYTEKRVPRKDTTSSSKEGVRPECKVAAKEDVEEEATDILEEDTSVLDEEEDATTFLDEEEETSILEEKATSLLVEDEEGTMLLTDTNRVCFPTLVRVLTEEKISINKPVFRLGKEKSYVDYFVTNNIAVSRSHADIITRGNKYFIKDLNSKNRTYINNQEIPIHMEVEIHDGDRLKLGNEEFIFNV